MKNRKPTLFFLSVLCLLNLLEAQDKSEHFVQNQNQIETIDYPTLNQKLSQKQLHSSKETITSKQLLPITYTFDGTWAPSNPIGIANSVDILILDSGTVDITANTVCSNVIINAGATITIDAGVTLSASTINLYSTSKEFSSLILNGNIVGVVNYHKHTEQIGTNDLISSPLDNQSFEDFALQNPNLASNGLIRAFASYNTATGQYYNYSMSLDLETLIPSGQGFRAATTDGATLKFTGAVRSDDVLGVQIEEAQNGGAWNLIGNPYPSYLDFDAFFTHNRAQFGEGSYQAIYGYDGDSSNGWTIWNQATIDSPSVTELIAPGQAFFVKAKSGGGFVDFTTDMRCTGDSDDFILGRSSSSPHRGHIKLNVSAENSSFSTDFYFNTNATQGFDAGYDSALYGNDAPDFAIYSQLVDNNSGASFAIQAFNPDSMYDVVVPLGLNASQGQEITVTILETDMPESIEIYLEDRLNNTFTLLNTNDYVFTANSDVSGIGRFYLSFSGNALGMIESNLETLKIYSDYNTKSIVVSGLLENDTVAKLYDINGRVILSNVLKGNNSKSIIDVSHLSTGIYIIELTSHTNEAVKQKLIIK